MENEHTSRVSRRRVLQQAGALGLAVAAGGVLGSLPEQADAADLASALTLTPEQEEGPFYVALEKIRKNITLGRPGIPLHLQMKVVDTKGKPVVGAACDIWQCDATGVYSDESSESTVGQTWLRGVQFTNASGVAQFVSVYPGHYQGRTTHVHVKVHIGGAKGHVSHTGQLLFDDAVSTVVYQHAPYTSDTAARVYNASDHVYTEQGGVKSKLKLTKLGANATDGYLGKITLVVNPKATPQPV
jgi:protocatechuate 3,4-dioxygenase beta subunit